MNSSAERRPSIRSTPTTATYWEALSRRELLLARCRGCGHTFHYPRERCPACWGAEIRSIVASGRGRVTARTIIHRVGHPAWQAEVPYVVALVQLDEGPVLLTNIVTAEPDDAIVGTEVGVEFQKAGDAVIAVFRPLLRD